MRLLFQPSEESFGDDGVSGATAMIQDAALEGVDKVIALHVGADMEAGKLYFNDEFSLAAVDSFEVWLRGDGGHGAYPHKGSDPLFMLSVDPAPHLRHSVPAHRSARPVRDQPRSDQRRRGA